jgi:predicted secreted hydrolase
MTSITIRLAKRLKRIALTGLCLIPALAGAAPVDPADTSFRLAQEGYRYEFPRDHGADASAEWWYYTV